MPNMLEEKYWEILLRRIKEGKCTPFLGSGVCAGKIPVGSQTAKEWAERYDYQMEDSYYDLTHVAQYVAVTEKDEAIPRDEICNKIKELLKEITPKYFEVPDEFVLGNTPETQKEEAQKYLDQYFEEPHIHVYWQDCREFAKELRTRWEAFDRGN